MPNMKLTQDWVGYLDRSYAQIVQSVLTRLSVNNPEITDHSPGNVLIIILTMFAGIAEMLNLYIDRMGQEAYLGTARKYTSILKLVKILDYAVKARRAARVELTFTIIDTATGLPGVLTTPLIIPSGTEVDSKSGLPFLTTEALTIKAGDTMGDVNASQYASQTTINLGATDGTNNQRFLIGADYQHGTASLVINGEDFTLIDSFGLALPHDRVFIVETDENLIAYAVLGDNTNGYKPIPAFSVFASYQSTEGTLGNLPPNNITDLKTVISLPTGFSLSVANQAYSFGGQEFESLEEIRANAPRGLRTLKRAVTAQDYEDLAREHLDVSDAKVTYCCGECVKIYLAPKSRGIANQQLLDDLKNYFACKRILGRCNTMLQAGITRIWVKMTINAKYLVQPTDALQDVAVAFDSKYSFDNSKINRPIRYSDLVALVDGVSTVEFVRLDEIWAEPFARPDPGVHLNTLRWVPNTSTALARSEWMIRYMAASNNFEVYRGGVIDGIAYLNVPYVGSGLVFTISPGTYQDGNRWYFTVYPANQDIVIDDLTIPIIDVDLTVTPASGFFSLTIIPNNQQGSCTPTCK